MATKKTEQVRNLERVGSALALLQLGLRPFAEREMKAHYGGQFDQVVQQTLTNDRGELPADPLSDIYLLLRLVSDHWNQVFRRTLGPAERSHVKELQQVRNAWAHQEPFTLDNTDRALDTTKRLLEAISAEEAAEVDRLRQEVMAERMKALSRSGKGQGELIPIEGQPKSGLKSWREIITPHPDVASGRYQQAEFAADLSQVHRGDAASEYGDPKEFFGRTYITAGLGQLLTSAAWRLSGSGGDPVIELQTNFGGGKTHSLLALYHLFSGVVPKGLAGVPELLESAEVTKLPKANRAVLVGTAISPGKVHEKPGGTKVHTLWGELAWQLGGAEGYAIVSEADRSSTNPGDTLVELFKKYSPCLVLIDEWVAYARQLYGAEGLPAGNFDTHFTFAQALTEAASAVDQTLVVVSIPASEFAKSHSQGEAEVSDIEIGGEGGHEALARLKNVVSRIASSWRPASAEESFEIVRRRLFDEVSDVAARDAVVDAFADLYKRASGDFPSDCKEKAYRDRVAAAYPIHPELFDRLYDDWSTLEKFQRTRGVLRLMAAVVHSLWEGQDPNLLIMPGTVPIDDRAVQSELTRYLEDNWVPVIEKDVDGKSSLPLEIDRANPNLGRYSATRRVSRTIYLGSAPTVKTAHRGIEEARIRLGCVQPGENPAIFGDALRRLTDQAQHLYSDRNRFWLSTQPTVTNLAQQRAETQKEEDVEMEIERRLGGWRSDRGDFAGVHIAPESGADVPDAPEARLVILGPTASHSPKSSGKSPALAAAAGILDQRGAGPRVYRNMLVFAAADKTRLGELEGAARSYLAWTSIDEDKVELNLDQHNLKQVATKVKQFDETVAQRMFETYQWVLVPSQPDPQKPAGWEEVKVAGQESVAVKASRKLVNEEMLITAFAGTRLRYEMDRVPLWQGESIGVRALWELFAQYVYLPRLRDQSVFVRAVEDGVASLSWSTDTFAYAEGHDDKADRYKGLRGGSGGSVILDANSLLVKSDVAEKQLASEKPESGASDDGAGEGAGTDQGDVGGGESSTPAPPEKVLRRFHGSVVLDPVRANKDIASIADNIVQHLLKHGEVELRLEVAADLPEGAPDDIVRTVTENAKVLKFDQFGFEEE